MAAGDEGQPDNEAMAAKKKLLAAAYKEPATELETLSTEDIAVINIAVRPSSSAMRRRTPIRDGDPTDPITVVDEDARDLFHRLDMDGRDKIRTTDLDPRDPIR